MRPNRIRHRPPYHPAHRVVFGLGVIGIGTLALLDNLHVFGMPLLRTFWPLALVLFGLSRIVWPRHAGNWLFGIALVIVGAVMTAQNLDLVSIRLRDWWPVFIILAGLSILARGMFPRYRGAGACADTPSTLEHGDRIAIDASFSAIRQQNDSRAFKGGRIDVTFGGVELDLRQAAIEGPEAVLEISARFSGVELRVPRDWQVIVDIAPTLGGVEDRTVPPMNPTQRLVLRGDAMFGGVEVKN
ncbi:LiaI-LiaF-like domain-containing protein [Roseateles sp. P5_E11]